MSGSGSFAHKLGDILVASAVNSLIAIGHRTGILRVLFDRVGLPQSLESIATVSGKNLRFVTELVHGLICADVILVKDNTNPLEVYVDEERAAALQSTGIYCQEIPLLNSCAMTSIEQCFDDGKGLPYSTYPQFSSFMAELSQQKHKDVLVSTFLPSVADGNLIASLDSGIKVCDFGCGHGLVSVLMAKRFPKSVFFGFDLLEESIEAAKTCAQEYDLTNCSFRVLDLSDSNSIEEYKEEFDYITAFDSIHDQTEPEIALKAAHTMLKSSQDSLFSLIDIKAHTNVLDNRANSFAPFLYTVSLMHCMPVGKGSDGKGRALGMMWGQEQATAMLEQIGFCVDVQEIPNDSFNIHYECRKRNTE